MRRISAATELILVRADGTRPEPGEAGSPQPGDGFFSTENVFRTKDGKTKSGNSSGTNAIHCLFGAASYLHCEGTVFLDRGQLHVETTFSEATERFETDVAFDGGTEKFRDAGGDANLTRIAPGTTLWEVHLLHLCSR